MPVNPIIRFLAVAAVMAVVGAARYLVGSARLRKAGEVEPKAREEQIQLAKRWALVAAFVYMVAMVSVVGLL